MPRPGDDTELFGVVADVLERRLHRDRPLWECWVVEGLKGNRWAMLMKIHHCMADGISAIRILSRLCDDIEGDAFARPVAKRSTRRPHLKPVPDHPPRNNPLSNLWRTATGITDVATRTVSGTVDIAASLLRPTPGSSLVGPVTAMRRYRAVRVPLADVEQVCRKFDVTINDVALATIPPIALQLRTGVAILSYADDLVFGITADYDAGSDIDELADGIKIAVARLDMLTQDSLLLFDRKSV